MVHLLHVLLASSLRPELSSIATSTPALLCIAVTTCAHTATLILVVIDVVQLIDLGPRWGRPLMF